MGVIGNNNDEMSEEMTMISFKRSHVLIYIAVLAVFIIACIILVVIIGSGLTSGEQGSSAGGGESVMEAGEVSAGISVVSSTVDENKNEIRIPGYPSIEIGADSEKVALPLLNPDGNPCYFKYRITLRDSGELLFESGLMRPGEALDEITLSRGLSAGEYKAVIEVLTFSLKDETPMNGAELETLIIAG